MGYANWAAKRGVPIDAIQVEGEADYDGATTAAGLQHVPLLTPE